MKINGIKIVSYDKLTGYFVDENGINQLVGAGMDIDLKDNALTDEKPSAVEFAKIGYTADDLMKLKSSGVI